MLMSELLESLVSAFFVKTSSGLGYAGERYAGREARYFEPWRSELPFLQTRR